MKQCLVPNCGKRRVGRGYCMMHYTRLMKTGDVQAHLPKTDKRGSRNPKWKGGEISDKHGRVLIYSPDHPNPSYCRTHVYRYRLVMEKHLGRYLRPDEIVHHKNGIKNDDRVENLEVMNRSEHALIHYINGDGLAKRNKKRRKINEKYHI